MIGLLVVWQSETLEDVKKCSFQCDRVEYDWEKGMTFGMVRFDFWGRESCCDNIGWSAPMSWRKAKFRSDGGRNMIGFGSF